MRRVVVTGLGMVTPLANGVEATWSRILAGQSGAGLITRFDAEQVATKYACEVPLGDGSGASFAGNDNSSNGDKSGQHSGTQRYSTPHQVHSPHLT